MVKRSIPIWSQAICACEHVQQTALHFEEQENTGVPAGAPQSFVFFKPTGLSYIIRIVNTKKYLRTYCLRSWPIEGFSGISWICNTDLPGLVLAGCEAGRWLANAWMTSYVYEPYRYQTIDTQFYINAPNYHCLTPDTISPQNHSRHFVGQSTFSELHCFRYL